MTFFEIVADDYDAARPSYPDGIYDALGPLGGLDVLEIGAGTGIATRQLRARGASVVAVDRGPAVLGRAATRTSDLAAIVADGAALPVRDSTVDLVCAAQAWHWVDPEHGCREAHRVLRAGGRWAAWWSHPRADGEAWFDRCWSIVEAACPGTHRGQRDIDWGEAPARSGLFDVGDPLDLPWVREVTVDHWMTDQATHSYVIGLADSDRQHLLRELRRILDHRFPDGTMSVRYATRLWIGAKR